MRCPSPSVTAVHTDQPRPAWKTLLFGALLALIPLVGAGISAVSNGRRTISGTYAIGAALKTALIQTAAILLLVLISWFVCGLLLGVSITRNP